MGNDTITLPEGFVLDGQELPDDFVLDEPKQPLDPKEEDNQINRVLDISEKTGFSPAKIMRRQTMIDELFNREDRQEAIEQRQEEKREEGAAGYWSELLDATARGTARVGAAFKNAQSFMSSMRTTPLGPSTIESSEAKQFREQRAKEYQEEANLLWEVAKHPELAAQEKGKINKAINLVGETIPYITATTAAYIVAGPMGGFAVGANVEGNSAYKEAIDAGVSEDKAKAIGVGVGIVSGAIEAFGGKYAEQLLLKTTAKLKNKLAKAGAVFTIGTAVEALEEGAQEIAAIAGEETYRDVDWDETATRIAGSMAGGAFLGGAMRGAQIATKRLTQFPDKPVAERGLKPVEPIKEHAKLEEDLTKVIQEKTGLPEDEAREVAQNTIDDKFYKPPEEAIPDVSKAVDTSDLPPIEEAAPEETTPTAKPTAQETAGVDEGVGKQSHEMTLVEYKEAHPEEGALAITSHMAHIRQAVQEGKTIPENVLKDHPELAKGIEQHKAIQEIRAKEKLTPTPQAKAVEGGVVVDGIRLVSRAGTKPKYPTGFEWNKAKQIQEKLGEEGQLEIYDQADTGSLYGNINFADGRVFPVRIADHPTKTTLHIVNKARREAFIPKKNLTPQAKPVLTEEEFNAELGSGKRKPSARAKSLNRNDQYAYYLDQQAQKPTEAKPVEKKGEAKKAEPVKPVTTEILKSESTDDIKPLVEVAAPTEPQKGELKERKFVTSVKEQVPSAATRVAGQYMPRSTDELSIKARNLIQDDITTAESMARTGSNDESVAVAAELIKHYNDLAREASQRNDKLAENAMLDKVADITHETAAKLTELGRAVQAAHILSLDTPEGLLRFAARTIQKHNESVLEKRKGKHRGKRTIARRTAKKPKTRLVSKDAFEAAKKRLISQNVMRAGIDPRGFADLATIGVYHIQEGLIKFGDWSAQMVSDFGDSVKPHLEQIWGDANQMIDSSTIPGLVPDLTTEQTEHILSTAKEIENMPDGDRKAQSAQGLRNFIADLVPTPLMDKLIAVWKAGLLTGIKTSGLNTMSNLTHGVTEIAKDIPAVAVDSVVSLFTKERTFALSTRGYTGGIVEGFGKGWKYLKTGFDERNIAAKLDYKRVNMGKSRFAKWIQFYEEHVFRVMGAEDQPFYYGAKARSLMSQAIAQAKNEGLKGKEAADFVHKLVENPTDDMIRYSVLDAETAVFQNKTHLGDIAKSLQKTKTGQVIVPFGRTPSAVATQIIHYSPVGAVSTIKDNIGKGKFDQRLFSQGIGRAVTGTAALWLGGQIFKMGVMSLGRPKGEREQKLWEIEGRKENSIKINGKWRSVHVLGPIGNVLLIGGYFQQALESTGSPSEAIGTAFVGGAKSFTEQTFVRGVNQAITAIAEPEWGARSWFTSMAGSSVPTIVGDTARALDSAERRSAGPITRVQGRIPVLRNKLEPRIDVFGQDLPRYGGNPLEVMIDPTRPVKIKQDAVVDELRRLWDEGIKVSPTQIGNRQGYKGLTKEQNTELWRRAGQLVYHELFEIINGRTYSRRDDDIKGELIEDGVNYAKIQARAEMAEKVLSELPRVERQAKREELKKAGGLITREVERAMRKN